VRVRFLLGPAGSGKTFRCLAEVRAALQAEPAGAPLVFLSPKQATFQIERQLLATPEISGYSRLNIFSFERLAQFIFEKLEVAPPKILAAEGRVMVLRALLLRHQKDLQLFRQCAPRPGFALELSTVLTGLQQQQFTAARLLALAKNGKFRPELQNKLHDLALLLKNYELWLEQHGLRDANSLLDFATAVLRQSDRAPGSPLRIEGLWLDGFAEMTPQEQDFLAAIIPFCKGATLAFCLETAPAAGASRLSIWSAIGQTFQLCHARFKSLPDCRIEIETLRRSPYQNRFAGNPTLAHLEEYWAEPDRHPSSSMQHPVSGVRIVACPNLEAEATFAAREILDFVRKGNRFRDCALLVRSLEGYHHLISRTFRRHGVPFFLDRRESVSDHPLTELTRSALRLVAFDWPHDDWFVALKAGFCPVPEMEIDRLENNALQFGWSGRRWREPLPDEASERLRRKILPPFENLFAGFSAFRFQPTGEQLAGLLRKLWRDLQVEPALERWTAEANQSAADSYPCTSHPTIHATVLEQMNAWLDNLALAFPTHVPNASSAESRTVQEWLPILEAGLAGLTVGVIPPVLDEVLVGAIDRARNPDLKLTLVAGVNESVFPAAPATPAILTNFDRTELENECVLLGPNIYDQLSRERYLGYIACTRASDRLALTFSRQGNGGRTQNPSSFIAHLQEMFPQLPVDDFAENRDWRAVGSATELAARSFLAFSRGTGLPSAVVSRPPDDPTCAQTSLPAAASLTSQNQNWEKLAGLPVLKSLLDQLQFFREPDPEETLPPAITEKLYGRVLTSSVSRLEEFAQCPFRFFVHSGLCAGKRKIFELDARERGTFQHEVLRIFHDRLIAENRRWRDVTPADARERIGQIADQLAPDYREGLLYLDAQSRFDSRILTLALQDFASTLIAWMRGQYEFDPVKAEWAFGFEKSPAPAWTIGLVGGHQLALRGKIDRIDLCRDGDHTLAVVTDYKSSPRSLDKILLQNGVQLQLLAYLAAVRNWPPHVLGVDNIYPVGVFYVNLRGQFAGDGSREEILAGADEARRLAYRHSGRFDVSALANLDRSRAGDQFSYQMNQDGSMRKGLAEALPRPEFLALLEQVELKLRELGESIFSGAAQVDPYRKGTATACDYCDYRPICRIDHWTHQWRVLRSEN
jgi:ATP-dependent helicase/nuclease subunit B